ncbi:MAG: MATE family efflux transporter [Spirochaetales bacterium]|nr:MATE family efflux transporter [Spirochaetales bacterium]
METRNERSLAGQLLRVALPIMLANLLQTLYNMVDAYYLGKLGKEAISAPSITMNVSIFIIAFGVGFSIAGTTMIAQAYGADKNNRERVDFLASQVFILNLFMSLVVLILGSVLTRPLLRLLQVPEGLTFNYASQYMAITFMGMPFFFIDMVLRGSLQGIGDSLTPLYVQTVAVLFNVVLDPIFIFGFGPIPAMEVAGAAIATNIARFFSSSVSLFILFHGKKLVRVRLKHLRPQKKTIMMMLRIGMPASIGQAFSSLGFAVIQGVVNSFGSSVIAAFGVGNRVTALFNMPAQGISQGCAVLSGKKLGEGKHDEAEGVIRSGLWIIGVFISFGMALVFIFGDYLVRFFVDDAEVVFYGVQMFRYTTISVVFFALYTVVCGAFQAGGKTRPVMTMNLVRLWGLRVPLSYILPLAFGLGTQGIWLGMALSNMLVAIWAFILFRKGSWKVTLKFDS